MKAPTKALGPMKTLLPIVVLWQTRASVRITVFLFTTTSFCSSTLLPIITPCSAMDAKREISADGWIIVGITPPSPSENSRFQRDFDLI